MAIQTPEDRRRRMAQRHPDAVYNDPARIPQMQVDEIATEEVRPTARRVGIGETGLTDPQADSQMRIRQNAPMRNLPTAEQPQLRAGLGEQSQEALRRAERFTSATGNITQPALSTQVRPRAVGGALAAGLGASTAAMNAAQVYDRTGGDIAETAKQVAYDAPAAIGSTLGAVAGGVLGRRSPTASTAGMLAGGALGDTGGNQIAAGVDRLLGGEGLSPLQALQSEEEAVQAATPLTPEQQNIDATLRALDEQEVAQRTGAVPPPTSAVPAPVATPTAQTPVDVPVAAPEPTLGQTAAPAPAGNGYGQTPVPGVVGRVNDQGVTEFSNARDDVAGAQGQFDAGGRLGDGQGTFSQLGDSALAMQRFERANAIRRQGALDDMQARQMQEQVRTQRIMSINESQARDLLRRGDVNSILQARSLQRENAQLGEQLQNARASEQALGLGQLDAEVQRERTNAEATGLRDYLALQRQQSAQTAGQTRSREEIAGRNAETFDQRVQNLFAQQDPVSGETAVPQQTMALIEERAPVYAQQREAALRESIAALQQRAQAGDAGATQQLEQARQDYARFRQDVYRTDAAGNPVELRPVREWSEDSALPFFTDVRDQQLRQTTRTDSLVPDLAGAAAGALAGSRVPGGPRARVVGALAGGALGAIAGDAAEQQGLGPRSTAPRGAQNASATIAGNYDRVGTDGDNIVATLNDGSVVNLSDLARVEADPSITRRGTDILPSYGRGSRSSQFQPVIRATFDATVAQLNSTDPEVRAQAQDALAQFARDDALYQSLTERQRARVPRQTGLGE